MIFPLCRYDMATSDEDRAKIETSPLKVFHQAIENCKPILGVNRIKRGGKDVVVSVRVSC